MLLTMLPHLSHLSLGGSILLNFPFLNFMLPDEPNSTHWRKSDLKSGLDMSWILKLVGPRLTVLELPIDLRRNLESTTWTPLSISRLPNFFPRLQWLSIPHMAATEPTHTSVADVIHVYPAHSHSYRRALQLLRTVFSRPRRTRIVDPSFPSPSEDSPVPLLFLARH